MEYGERECVMDKNNLKGDVNNKYVTFIMLKDVGSSVTNMR